MCRQCQRLPKKEIEQIIASQQVWDFLNQSHISDRNILRLQEIIAQQFDPGLTELASVVLEIAIVKPYKKKRLRFIKYKHPSLWKRMIQAGILEQWPDYDLDIGSEENLKPASGDVPESGEADIPF